jgi:pimeloyl-ACP methyl ester carboxylesterase
MQEKRIKTNQIELQIRDDEHEGEAVIFLHFSGANRMMWQRALPWFEGKYHLVLVDLRGHGKSDKPEGGYNIDNMARDIVEMMAQLGLRRAHIVGSSLGAEVGLSLAANYPKRVISLVCEGAPMSEYGPYSTWEGSEADFEVHVTEELDTIRNRPETLYPSLEVMVGKYQEAFEKHGLWNEWHEVMVRYGAYQLADGSWARLVRKPIMLNYLEGYFHCRFEDYYPKVKCPLLLIPDADAYNRPQERAVMEKLCALAYRGQIAAVEGWDHPYGWLTAPDGACAAILAFLQTPRASEVTPEDVIRIYQRFLSHGFQVWLSGGWGIDALLGEQTRPHKDLDVIMLLEDVNPLCGLLAEDGFYFYDTWSENRYVQDTRGKETATGFILEDWEGRQLDIHAMTLDEQGNGIPDWVEAEGFIFTKEDLAGEGMVGGVKVPCLSPQMQVRAHTGYELPEKQIKDLELLHEKFGIEYPDEYFHLRPSGA